MTAAIVAAVAIFAIGTATWVLMQAFLALRLAAGQRQALTTLEVRPLHHLRRLNRIALLVGLVASLGGIAVWPLATRMRSEPTWGDVQAAHAVLDLVPQLAILATIVALAAVGLFLARWTTLRTLERFERR